MDILLGHLGQGIWLILLLSLPAVLTAAAVGLVIGILQAVTQVQEQTISAAPKILLVFLLILFGGPFMLDILKEYTAESVHLGMEVIPRSEAMVLPPKPRMAYGEKDPQKEFFKEKYRGKSPSKIKDLMNSPSKAGSLVETNKGLINNSSQPKPKPGVGEQIYMKRREAGSLPNPPRYKKE